MKNYEWILFDADETLFHFDSFTGLEHLFAQFGLRFTKKDYKEYQTTNQNLWTEYQSGLITAQQLQHQRFDIWATRLNTSSHELNSAFLAIMAEICTPLDGASHLLDTLKGQIKLGIITNGFTELQNKRLERAGFKHHFDILVISEQVGIAKPHRGIFDHALSIMGNPSREKVLMVGDTLESDILGGINAGIDTCWLNAHKKPASEEIKPHYEVTSLIELRELLLSTNAIKKD